MQNMTHRFLLFLFNLLLGCLLGCIILLFYASRSDAVREEIKKTLQKTFKEEFNCDWDARVESVNLLTLHVEFKDVTCLPCNRADGWKMYVDTFHIKASVLDFIMYHTLNCHSYFENLVVFEKQVSQTSHFMQVLNQMFASDLPADMTFNYITIKQAQMILENTAGDIRIDYRYNCQMSKEKDGIHTKLYLLDGKVAYKDNNIVEKIFGNFVFIYPYSKDLNEIYVRADCRLSIPALQEKGECFLVGDLYATRGAFVISNEDQSFIIEPLKIRLKQDKIPCTCSMSMNSEIFQRIFANRVVDENITGNISITITANLLDLVTSVQGKIQLYDVMYKNNVMCKRALCTIFKKDMQYVANLSVDNTSWLEGVVSLQDKDIHFDIYNLAPLQLWWNRYWDIPAQQGKVSGLLQADLQCAKGTYHAALESIKLDGHETCYGTFVLHDTNLSIKGFFAENDYTCVLGFVPSIHLVEFTCSNQEEVVLDFHEQKNNTEQGIEGFVGFNFIKNLVPEQYKSSFSQAGKFEFIGDFDQGAYHAQVTTENAHMRIPSLYNVLQQFKATMHFGFMTNAITLDDMVANLYEGEIACDHALAVFDKQAIPSFLYIPLSLDRVLMNWNKSIFGTVSGRVTLFQQKNHDAMLQGNLFIDQAQLKGNIFSQEFQNQLLGDMQSSHDMNYPCNLDVTIETKEPIVVETSFLHARVNLDLHVTHSLKQPEIEGSIDIASGELKFPYKSLFITHGQILIMPKHSTEPMIEFEAKGKIKRYDITMRATGTMIDQQIHFESSPYLTEEQIISLLLAGSQDSSLSVVMQTMFMQKLHEIVFGPAISKSKLDSIFNRLLQSFKNIRIFPQFTNQTGRGGVRGVVEIDATDRLHGRIDTNLMQLEDTIFEADYVVTDDVTVRAIKDGPSTYGGEVEMRWKFS